MADFKVFGSKIELLDHPQADKLMIVKVGNYSLVVGKSSGYNEGDIIFFAPEKSILPDEIKGNYSNQDTGVSYLKGTEHNRVGRIRLRGVDSDGVTLNNDWVLQKGGWSSLEDIPLNQDLSETLGIKKYEVPIPTQLAGEVYKIEGVQFQRHHDVEQFRLYSKEFTSGELVFCSEKLHGSQISIMKTMENNWLITSKGIGKKQLVIKESEANLYWQAFHNSDIKSFFESIFPGKEVQIFGEVLPAQRGFSYGQDKPKVYIFRIIVDNIEMQWNEIEEFHGGFLLSHTVPNLYKGPYDEDILIKLSKGKETVSGKNLHIKEGIVVRPQNNRKAKEGFPLFLKVINPAYVESGDEFS